MTLLNQMSFWDDFGASHQEERNAPDPVFVATVKRIAVRWNRPTNPDQWHFDPVTAYYVWTDPTDSKYQEHFAPDGAGGRLMDVRYFRAPVAQRP